VSYEAHLQKIKEAKNDNKLVFFIGSGMSKNVGLPDWGELINELKKDLNTKEEDKEDNLKIAQLYFLEFGGYEYIKKIKSYFPLEISNTQNIHQLLIKIFPQHIITTNWDTVIEKAIDDEMALYDIVRNDGELINTTSNRKLIKMHGDIEIENIVFKEDDYLEYSQKFPLIENYVKSILSTNTIVFLGYSYNDMNLKYITKWIQNSSKVRPPAYMITEAKNKIQEKYLKNHGISVLSLSDKYPLKTITLQIEFFLKDILTARNNFTNIQNELELIDTFYNLFQNFEHFNIVLIDQLSKLLKNKSVKFLISFENSERIVIHLQDYYLFIDKIFNNFRTLFEKKKRQEIISKIKFIITVLHKSGIVGIAIESNKYHLLKEKIFKGIYKLDNYIFEPTQNCGNNKKDAYTAVWNEDFKQAYIIYKELIISAKKTKNYIEMFLLMYSSNIILRVLKIIHPNEYKDDELYDINQKFLELKQSIREQLEPLLFMVRDDNYLYKYMYDVKIFHENCQKQAKSIQNGRRSFSNNETEARQKHKNLLYFVNNNYLCVDIYEDFKNLQIEYIKTTLTRQFRKKTKTLDDFELYACIKYIDKNKLKDIFDYLLDETSVDYKKFELNDTNREYLQQLLESLTSQLANISDRDQIQKFETYWKNTLYLLSLSAYPNIENLIDLFSKVLRIGGSIDIYREINIFLRIQKYIFNVSLNNSLLYSLLEIAIHKILSSNYNTWDVFALERNELLKYVIDNNENIKYTNIELITSFLTTLKNFDNETQVKISNYFLLGIYDFSNEEIQNSIKEYISKINLEEFELKDIVEFKLLLLTRDIIKIGDFDFENKITEYIKPYEDGKIFTTHLSMISDFIQYLIKEKNIEQLQGVQEKIVAIIKQHENLKLW
jgi:hypothetical protein